LTFFFKKCNASGLSQKLIVDDFLGIFLRTERILDKKQKHKKTDFFSTLLEERGL